MPAGLLQPPTAHPDDAPLVCLSVNQEWLAYLIGMVYPARYPEYWGGTLEENRRARQDVLTLMAMLQDTEDCGMANVCCEPQIYIYRINPDTGRPERSIPESGVWTPDPTDPMFDVRLLPPLVRDTTEVLKCDSATNALEHIEDLITTTSENIGTAITVFDLAVAVAGFLLEVLIIVLTGAAATPAALEIAGLIWAAANAAFVEGKTAFDDYWTNENKDKILCALVCTIGDDGRWTVEQYEDFKHKVRQDLPPSPALDMVLTSLNAAGQQGLNQMAAYGAAAGADCSACDCDESGCFGTWGFFDGNAGTTVTKTDSTWVIDANIRGDSNYYVIIVSTGADDCCQFVGISPTADTYAINVSTWCGTDPMTIVNSGNPDAGAGSMTNPWTAVLLRRSTPFTVTFTS